MQKSIPKGRKKCIFPIIPHTFHCQRTRHNLHHQRHGKGCFSKGLKLLGITDHGPATLAAGTSSYFRSLIYSPRKRFDVELLYGIELNILDTDGKTDLPQELLDKLDYAIASMHYQNFRPKTGKKILLLF